MILKKFLTALAMLATAGIGGTAFAHTGHGGAASFTDGFLHPLLGPDHLFAMVALGIWVVQLGSPAILRLPAGFLAGMAGGWFVLTWGIPLAGVEAGVALTSLALGLLILFAVRAPIVAANVLAAGFAVFHGYVHGLEMPADAGTWAYAAGFLSASALLIALGIGTGKACTELARGRPRRMLLPSVGGAIAIVGLALLVGAL